MSNPACPGIFTGAASIPCTLTGRYVGVVIPGKAKQLTLCEVEAYTTVGHVQFKATTATMSSNLYPASEGALLALKGNTGKCWDAGNVAS